MKPLQPFWTVTKKFYKKSRFIIFDWSKITFDRSSVFFNRLNRNRIVIETFRNSRIFSLPFSIDWAKDSTDWKCYISNFHLEKFITWIFTLWNYILQTHTSLLQPIFVYIYIYNKWIKSSWPSKRLDLFILFYFEHKSSLSSLLNKIICLNLNIFCRTSLNLFMSCLIKLFFFLI